jgi:hypothetical protein
MGSGAICAVQHKSAPFTSPPTQPASRTACRVAHPNQSFVAILQPPRGPQGQTLYVKNIRLIYAESGEPTSGLEPLTSSLYE